ncbi:hypothetical protein HDE_13939 [Halotydeus destructor]|nr:hypothetical protein HDE_13939 [Halotydeus destructor]
MANFRIDNHFGLLCDSLKRDMGKKNVPDFYYNLLFPRNAGKVVQERIYKVPERILTTFSSKLRKIVTEEANQTPADMWSHPIAILIEDVPKDVMELVIQLLVNGQVQIRYQDVERFQCALSALEIQTVNDSNSSPEHSQNSEPEPKSTTAVPTGGQVRPSPSRSTNGNPVGRASRTPSSSTAGTSPQPIYASTPVQSIRILNQLTANGFNGYGNYTGTPEVSATVSAYMNGTIGFAASGGVFQCQVASCQEHFTSAQDSVKHYTTHHKIRIYKNNGEYKQVKV